MGLILVVSDDLVEIDTIKSALSVHGWWVTVAQDREAALQIATDQSPKLVMVDTDLADAPELVRSFGARNGGPGVVSCVPQGFDRARELQEAGSDELLTKPASPAAVVEVVQRCLAAPRAEPTGDPESSTLLTTEEIFGDVLREIELGDDRVVTNSKPDPAPLPAAPPPSLESAPPVPPRSAESAPVAEVEPRPVLLEPADDDPLAPAPTIPLPPISLAGLFDDSDDREPVAAPAVTPPPESSDGEWDGVERRGAGRPWKGSEREVVVADAAPETDESTRETLFVDPAATADPDEVAPQVESDWIDQLEGTTAAESGPEASGAAVPRTALTVGAIAAALLVVAGIVFWLGRGADGADAPAQAREVAAPAAAAPSPADPVTAPAETAAAGDPAPAPDEQVAAEPAADEAEDINLEAIVDQELQRREEELRRVFLEEEKRLLRELKNLDDDEPPADEDESGDRAGIGR